jgi:hypothetical protein
MSNWNRLFTNIIRQSNSTYWGNWSLDSNIQPGAIGTLLEGTGSFKCIGRLENVNIKNNDTSFTWKFASHNVSRTDASTQLDASATDPETGTKVEAGLRVEWGFNEKEGLISEFSISRVSSVDKLLDVITSQKELLFSRAKDAGMGDGKSVSQGFGIISSVLYARSGLNVGSSDQGNTFSLSGTVKGINELVGADVGINGSYSKTSSKSSVDLHIWPDLPNIVSQDYVPIAFTFVSFDGDIPLWDWVQTIPSLVLVLKNTHGGTYRVEYELEYHYDGNPVNKKGSVSGALTQTIGDIPVGATAMKLKLKFDGVFSHDRYEVNWQVPHNEWIGNTCNVELYGVWPAQTRYEVNYS